MTARPLVPVIPSSSVPASRQRAKAATASWVTLERHLAALSQPRSPQV